MRVKELGRGPREKQSAVSIQPLSGIEDASRCNMGVAITGDYEKNRFRSDFQLDVVCVFAGSYWGGVQAIARGRAAGDEFD